MAKVSSDKVSSDLYEVDLIILHINRLLIWDTIWPGIDMAQLAAFIEPLNFSLQSYRGPKLVSDLKLPSFTHIKISRALSVKLIFGRS